MEKYEDKTGKMIEIACEFDKLSKEEQKALAVVLIGRAIGYEYVDRTIEAYEAGNLSMVVPPKEKVDSERIKLNDKVTDTLNSMVSTILGEDDELRFRVFRKIIDGYGKIERETRKDICANNHDYTDWIEKIGKVPEYDEDGDIEGYIDGRKFYERKCKYCGYKEQAYSEYHKERLEKDGLYWAEHKSEPIYTKKK